jgi:hypothetical protein
MVAEMVCPACGTGVSGHFDLPLLSRLTDKEQEFVLGFVLSSGSLKEIAGKLGVSYPTVRNMLDDIIEKLKTVSDESVQ